MGPSFQIVQIIKLDPSLEETLTPEGIINPDIAQETGVNYELGSEWLFFQKRFSANLTLYRMNVENLLVAERVGEDQYIGNKSFKHLAFEVDQAILTKN